MGKNAIALNGANSRTIKFTMPKCDQGREVLERYMPPGSFPFFISQIEQYKLKIKVAGGRTTKYGDFNPSPANKDCPQISINSNLNPYSFLITLLHELAHFLVWNDGHIYAKPHGRTWKLHFIRLMNEMILLNIFPEELKPLLQKHLKNPKATSCSDATLFKKLAQYDEDKPGVYIDEIPDNTLFETSKGDVFKKIRKIKSRSLCKQVSSGRKYLFSPVYRVFPLKDKQYIMVFPLFFILLPDK